jgi:hypothetical protein
MSRTERPELAKYTRLRVFVFVDSVDLAEIQALRYGKGLNSDELIAVHFVIDADHAAQLQQRWQHFEHDIQLRVIDCPDRHLPHAAQELVFETKTNYPDTNVTVLLPRRTFSPLLGRLLHDRTADKMARAVSQVLGATAIIVPYDIESRIASVAPTATKNGWHDKPTRWREGRGTESSWKQRHFVHYEQSTMRRYGADAARPHRAAYRKLIRG